MAADVGLGDVLRADDLTRVYSPKPIMQERLIRQMQREQILAALNSQSSPAANTAPSIIWPPKPDA